MDLQNILPDTKTVASVIRHNVNELPSPPVVAIKLLKLIRQENASLDELSTVIKTDPATSAKVLRIVNSAHFGLRNKISSIKHAVVLLGFSEIHNLALEISLFEQLTATPTRFSFDRTFFWRHCLSTAKLAKALAQETNHPDPSEVYIAGLLHDVGKIIADVYGHITYSAFLSHIAKSDKPLEEEERKLMGLGHDDIGAYICAEWGLPESVILAIKFHHQRFTHLDISDDNQLLIALVSLANFITWTQGLGSVKILRHPILQPEIEEIINLQKFHFGDMIKHMDAEVKSIANFYEFTFPTTDQFREKLLDNNLRLSRMNTKYYYLHDDLKNKLHSINKIKKSLVQPHQSLNPDEIISSTLQAIQQDFHFDRLFAFNINRSLSLLSMIGSLDSLTNHTPEDITIPLHKNSGSFLHCLRNQEPIIIDGNYEEEEKTLQILQTKEIGILPITTNNKVTGIIMVDNYHSKKRIKQEELEAVSIIASELGLALDNAHSYEEVKSLAYLDGLTKINNRNAIDKLLQRALKQCDDNATPLTLGMVDVDLFKHFNDNFGHLAGDSILKLLATVMKKVSRPTDTVGRFGGEEFIFILQNTGLSKGLQFAERLRKEVSKLGKLLNGRFPGRSLTISIGIATYTAEMTSKNELIDAADKALYRAKNEGRNKVRCAKHKYNPQPRTPKSLSLPNIS